MNEHSTTIHIASDHAGFEMKTFLKNKLIEMGHNVIDYGAHDIDSNDNYPDFILPCAQATANKGGFGIVLGGSGQGEQIIANKVDGVRAIEYYDENLEIIKLGREHNDANVLSIGARFITNDQALLAVKTFINTEFSNAMRHSHRLDQITKYEQNN